jgi:hypothetical protein
MFSGRLAAVRFRGRGTKSAALNGRRFFAQNATTPFPIVPSCPSPTCECAATPEMPDGLEIDHAGKLNGVVSSYAEQVLVCTGKDDWMSRIEEENSGDNLAADIKELFGRGGVYSDVSSCSRRRLVQARNSLTHPCCLRISANGKLCIVYASRSTMCLS